MNRTWLVIEKVLGILITAWGSFVLYSVVHTIAQTINSGYLSTGKITYSSLAQYNHLSIIISIIAMFGGVLLLFNDKSGWMLSVIATAFFAIMLFISSRYNSANSALTFFANFKSYGLLAILFFIFLILLLLKPFRQKYNPASKQWLTITVVIGLLILDKIIF